ncbi:MAG: 2-C-methyl-D-erythritol 2,4-cyclodiphosphate synthase [Bacteroidales bacterium]|jgi:2-C-methyl-D-erythritol 2,4-cyclodiphosphate synthase|nr:2-C-methyl-D-erythritol 2,4-cyclodiphosphate synthase [Bacteroidales bacterium]MDD2263545.1 2-C-methyl-D-erythritol 2,4-cyclodiphosphate synthase [Bacteroidales bacterium]MDD2830664.1 2-C-methyl-D-erythritol 2,4-cyclodiphosphate synthase [Bacteroidales bacterium]MDD3207863.1 2-C-methyl-D-erythritol 2,4-cyclodiphosphate synthase [Bacteroidales bacterium]MDD3696629.1 2-C-methyl-D-erythritol 2,4-cyclodiphosphate synthase [Bacteroidales bacterium]
MKKTAATNTQASHGNAAPASGNAVPRVDPLPRIGNGFDVHALAPGLPFFLGGVRIAHSKGCIAHSDGDCLLHALCDAMLGALALGDIGKHFPDTSDEYKGIDSKILLKKTYELIRKAGYIPGNVDCTVYLQAPKISHRIPEMRAVIAGILEMAPDAVSIKATTTERLGFVGREEGIAVQVTVLLWPEG